MRDRYWHIQMFLPEGKGGVTIDSIQMLKEAQPIIGTGEWNDLQCKYFKGERNGLSVGDIIMVREGSRPLALCKIIGDCFHDDNLTGKYINYWFRNVEVLDWADPNEWNSLFSQGTLKILYKHSETDSWHYINDWYKQILQKKDMKNIIDLLLHKKQIILQGAPGTGKTYLAKKIASQLIKGNSTEKPSSIQDIDILSLLQNGKNISSSADRTSYTINAINKTNLSLQGENTKEREISFNSIKTAYKEKLWEPGKQRNGLDPYTSSLAKYIYDNISQQYKNEGYVKLVQFHPSYTYEDFVRGIVVRTENNQPKYETENKTLGQFADDALKNWTDSNKQPEILSKEKWVEEKLNLFKENLQGKLENDEVIELKKGCKPTITALEEDSFRCNRYNNPLDSFPIKDKDIIYGYIGLYMEKPVVKIKENPNVSKSARSGMYYLYQNLINYFKEYLESEKITYSPSNENKVKLQNYVLIIDEINRANLPAVFGELIYALEYRGEKVESMYAVDGDNSLILPPNLYIIGTMNTADRSVGQIDYAIRRRFAFVDMLPMALTDEPGFDVELFKKVSTFFIENVEDYINEPQNTVLKKSEYLSDEFSPEDVWIGHSYFIMKDDNRDIRLKYEIKPILREYLKDGILRDSVKGKSVKNEINDL